MLPISISMAKIGEINTNKRKRMDVDEGIDVEWRITTLSSDAVSMIEIYYDSPAFSIAGMPFYFRFYPIILDYPVKPRFYLKSDIIRGFSVGYNFGFKKLGGSVKQIKEGIMKGNETCSDSICDVSITKVLRLESEITLTCTLKLESNDTTGLGDPKGLKLRRLEKLSKNLKDLFADKDSCDTTLKVNEKEYKAHRLILMARSSVFAATFKHDTLERQTGVITIPDCDPDSFQLFLNYLYSGQLEELSFRSALNLYYTSDKYDVPELKESCLEYLLHCVTVENVCELAIFADHNDEKKLFSAITDYFTKNTCEILLTSDWDDLLMKEPCLANKLLKEMAKTKLKR